MKIASVMSDSPEITLGSSLRRGRELNPRQISIAMAVIVPAIPAANPPSSMYRTLEPVPPLVAMPRSIAHAPH